MPHSQVHNDRCVPIKIRRLGHYNYGYIAYIAFFSIAHARYSHISISGVKSDITIVSHDPDFLRDVKILAIRVHLRQIYYRIINICMDFRGPLGLKLFLEGEAKLGKGFCNVDSKELVFFYFLGFYVCATFGENRSRSATVRVRTDGQTDTLTDSNRFLPRCMECNAVLTMIFLSVCPSVRLSVCQTRAL